MYRDWSISYHIVLHGFSHDRQTIHNIRSWCYIYTKKSIPCVMMPFMKTLRSTTRQNKKIRIPVSWIYVSQNGLETIKAWRVHFAVDWTQTWNDNIEIVKHTKAKWSWQSVYRLIVWGDYTVRADKTKHFLISLRKKLFHKGAPIKAHSKLEIRYFSKTKRFSTYWWK